MISTNLIKHIRVSEVILATLVAVGVVVFGFVQEAKADSTVESMCNSIGHGETSSWFCIKNTECARDCGGFFLGHYKWQEQGKVHKSPIYNFCQLVNWRCGKDVGKCRKWVWGPC